MFLAFTTPIPLCDARAARAAAVSPRRPPPRACANPPDNDAAIQAGQSTRDTLRKLSQEREAQAQRTQDALQDMSKQLSQIMAELRAESGMPPVADPPVTAGADGSTTAASTTSTSASSTPAQTDEAAAAAAASASDDGAEPYMDPLNFGYESTAGWQVLAEDTRLPETEGRVEFRISCDESGCSLVEVKGDETGGRAGVRSRFVQRGAGWRLGFDPDGARGACALVGNDAWTVSLSAEEMRHFKKLAAALQRKMDRIGLGDEEMPGVTPVMRRSSDGMYNMRAAKVGLDCSVEFESKLLWLQAIGQPVRAQYGLKAIFFDTRQVEAFWAPDAVPGLLAALNKIGIE